MDIETLVYDNVTLNNPIAVLGFPSVGLVSSIMANLYVNNLKMVPLAGMTAAELPPYCLVSNERPLPPIRFYYYKNKRKEGRDVIVCMTEYTPKPEDCLPLAKKVIMYLKSKRCDTIVCLEGAPRYGEDSSPMCIAAGPNADKLVKRCKLPRMTGGMIRGIVGVLMYEAPDKGMDILSIMVPANPGVPDPGSAAQFIDPVSKVIPGFRTTPKQLFKEAELIQRQVNEQQHAVSDTSQYIG